MSERDYQLDVQRRLAEAEETAQEFPYQAEVPGERVDVLRQGVAKIVTNASDGAYTITEQWYKPAVGSIAATWQDATAPNGYVAATARDISGSATGVVDQYVAFWEQRKVGGALELLLDIALGGLCFGKAVSPGWASGNSLTLNPWDIEADEDNGLPNVTAYIVSPTGKAITYAEIATDDIVGYLPYGDNKGLIVNVVHGGTCTTPKTMLPSTFETAAAQTDTWARDDQPTNDGATIRLQTRMSYAHGDADPKLYAYYRTFTYDSAGMVKNISSETRIQVDDTEPCPEP